MPFGHTGSAEPLVVHGGGAMSLVEVAPSSTTFADATEGASRARRPPAAATAAFTELFICPLNTTARPQLRESLQISRARRRRKPSANVAAKRTGALEERP